jgi:serine protease Do
MKNSISLVGAAILGGMITLTGNYLISGNAQTVHIVSQQSDAPQKNNKNFQLTTNTDAAPTNFSEAAERVMPAVVNITAIKEHTARSAEEKRYYEYFGQPRASEATGSGVIISAKGYIVTNNHVIKGSNKVEITLYDKRKFTATLIGTDPNTDLAVLKIEAPSNIPTIDFANSDEIKVGEWVLAVGNPFELTSTVTAGIVSAKGRNINILGGRQSIESFIQTDAAVNPGNSGGALVNTKGELVGINTAIATPTGTYAGYSFAVPINLAKKVVQDLIEHGEVRRGFLGIMIQDVNSELAQQLALDVTQGVYVNDLVPEGAAKAAGMQSGDVVIKVNGIKIKSVPELQEQIGSRNIGDDVKVTVWRGGAEKDLLVKLQN